MLGFDICGMSIFNTEPVYQGEINDLLISGAIFDTLKLDQKITDDFTISSEWESTTKIYTEFEGNLYAGNVSLGVDETNSIIVKRRKVGEFTWFNMFEIPVNSIDNFNFNVVDRYPNTGVKYQYAVVPIINGLEGSYNYGIDELTGNDYISCYFEGIIILDRDIEYESCYNLSFSFTKNQSKASVIPLNSKYPYIVKNGQANYYSGTVSAAFMRFDEENNMDLKPDSMEYREDFLDFLINQNFKIIKLYDGRSYMVEIMETPTDENSDHEDLHIITFDFIEVGNVLSNEDMYLNGFLDISEVWWNNI